MSKWGVAVSRLITAAQHHLAARKAQRSSDLNLEAWFLEVQELLDTEELVPAQSKALERLKKEIQASKDEKAVA